MSSNNNNNQVTSVTPASNVTSSTSPASPPSPVVPNALPIGDLTAIQAPSQSGVQKPVSLPVSKDEIKELPAKPAESFIKKQTVTYEPIPQTRKSPETVAKPPPKGDEKAKNTSQDIAHNPAAKAADDKPKDPVVPNEKAAEVPKGNKDSLALNSDKTRKAIGAGLGYNSLGKDNVKVTPVVKKGEMPVYKEVTEGGLQEILKYTASYKVRSLDQLAAKFKIEKDMLHQTLAYAADRDQVYTYQGGNLRVSQIDLDMLNTMDRSKGNKPNENIPDVTMGDPNAQKTVTKRKKDDLGEEEQDQEEEKKRKKASEDEQLKAELSKRRAYVTQKLGLFKGMWNLLSDQEKKFIAHVQVVSEKEGLSATEMQSFYELATLHKETLLEVASRFLNSPDNKK